MTVATRMVLLVNVIAVRIITFVMMHTKGCGMALVQPVKNMAAVGVDVMGAGMVKNLL
jgi:hypothetical protein